MSPRTWATWAEPQEGQLRRVIVSRINAASKRWSTSSMMLAGIATPSRRAAPPSGRLILPRPDQYGQRRLSTSPDTAPTAAVPARANLPAKSASGEVYAPGTPSDSSRSKKSVPKTANRPRTGRRRGTGPRADVRHVQYGPAAATAFEHQLDHPEDAPARAGIGRDEKPDEKIPPLSGTGSHRYDLGRLGIFDDPEVSICGAKEN